MGPLPRTYERKGGPKHGVDERRRGSRVCCPASPLLEWSPPPSWSPEARLTRNDTFDRLLGDTSQKGGAVSAFPAHGVNLSTDSSAAEQTPKTLEPSPPPVVHTSRKTKIKKKRKRLKRESTSKIAKVKCESAARSKMKNVIHHRMHFSPKMRITSDLTEQILKKLSSSDVSSPPRTKTSMPLVSSTPLVKKSSERQPQLDLSPVIVNKTNDVSIDDLTPKENNNKKVDTLTGSQRDSASNYESCSSHKEPCSNDNESRDIFGDVDVEDQPEPVAESQTKENDSDLEYKDVSKENSSSNINCEIENDQNRIEEELKPNESSLNHIQKNSIDSPKESNDIYICDRKKTIPSSEDVPTPIKSPDDSLDELKKVIDKELTCEKYFDSSFDNSDCECDARPSAAKEETPKLDLVDDEKAVPVRRSARLLSKQSLVNVNRVDGSMIPGECSSFCHRTGKNFRRSISILRHFGQSDTSAWGESVLDDSVDLRKGRKYREGVESVLGVGWKNDMSVRSSLAGFASRLSNLRVVRESILEMQETIREESNEELNSTLKDKVELSKLSAVACMHLERADPRDETAIALSRLSISIAGESVCPVFPLFVDETNARELVLRRCGQSEPVAFDQAYPEHALNNCRKIGEGVYGEVFLRKNPERPNRPTVMKVVPVEGDRFVNGEPQKRFHQVVSEVVVAMELSRLREDKYNCTSTFNELSRIRLVQGRYPSRLLELWDLYDETKGSENDRPCIFRDDQQFIILELQNGGVDLETFVFTNAEQSYSLFYQIAFALAVAEEAYCFEHRDLHWGNVLASVTDEEFVDFTLRGTTHLVRTAGVSASIIDFTLSRMTLPRSACTIFNDLADDKDLFTADGDYQFDIYRLMREKNGDEWRHYQPYSNVLWLDYVLSKLIKGVRYSKPKTKLHGLYMNKLKTIRSKILQYKNCHDFVTQEEYYF